MSDDQREIGFNEQEEKFPPRKTLYDKILESQGEKEGDGEMERRGEGEKERRGEGEMEREGEGETGRGRDGEKERGREKKSVKESVKDSGGVKSGGGRRRVGIFVALIVVMLGVIGYLVYVLMTERQEADEMRFTLELQKENLTNELNELYVAYDSLQTNNDSMNVLIEERQEQIRSLLAIRASNAKKIQIYEEQVASLRSVLRSYVVQVDSLNQANLRLQAENRAAKDQIQQASRANRQLEQNIKSLEETVTKAAVIRAINVQAEPIEDNGNIARRLKRTDKIRVSFSLAENSVAQKGLKRIYVRIANPNQRTMTKDPSQTVTFDGTTVPYSAYREVEYEGVQLDVSIFYDADDSEIIEGTYYVDLYMDGELIGTTTFSLK